MLTQLQEVFAECFQFKIGDFVYFRSAVFDEQSRPNAFTVVERVWQECPGGFQRLYRLQEWGKDLVQEIVLTTEPPKFRRLRPQTTWQEVARAMAADKQATDKQATDEQATDEQATDEQATDEP